MSEMLEFISRFYGISEARAREVIADMRDLSSKSSLAGVIPWPGRCPPPHRPRSLVAGPRMLCF